LRENSELLELQEPNEDSLQLVQIIKVFLQDAVNNFSVNFQVFMYEYVAKPDHPNPCLLYLIVDIVLQA